MTQLDKDMTENKATITKPRILIVGGGYSGFYAAKWLEKMLGKGEAEVTMVDPLPYMTYQPFLPEVAAGAIEPRHAVVSHRRHLKTTRLISGKVSKIDHSKKVATIAVDGAKPEKFSYDHVLITAGAVSRTFPIPGVAEVAIGMKNIEEAVEVRNRMLANFDRAASLPEGTERDRLLCTTVVGGGFAGIETIAELRSMATYLLRYYPEIAFEDVQFHLIEAMGRIMPEVNEKTGRWVVKHLEDRGCVVHLDTQLTSATKGLIELSTGESFESDVIIWTAGVMAHPVAKFSDLPIDDRGRIIADPTLRVTTEEGEVIEGAWTSGDVSRVPDLSGGGVGGYCVPNAQHAVRQGKRVAKNLVAAVRGDGPVEYNHTNLGAVAGLGIGYGVMQVKGFAMTGFIAWLGHRGYHGLAMPMLERKIRVIFGWVWNLFLRRDIASLEATRSPRQGFSTYAAKTTKK